MNFLYSVVLIAISFAGNEVSSRGILSDSIPREEKPSWKVEKRAAKDPELLKVLQPDELKKKDKNPEYHSGRGDRWSREDDRYPQYPDNYGYNGYGYNGNGYPGYQGYPNQYPGYQYPGYQYPGYPSYPYPTAAVTTTTTARPYYYNYTYPTYYPTFPTYPTYPTYSTYPPYYYRPYLTKGADQNDESKKTQIETIKVTDGNKKLANHTTKPKLASFNSEKLEIIPLTIPKHEKSARFNPFPRISMFADLPEHGPELPRDFPNMGPPPGMPGGFPNLQNAFPFFNSSIYNFTTQLQPLFNMFNSSSINPFQNHPGHFSRQDEREPTLKFPDFAHMNYTFQLSSLPNITQVFSPPIRTNIASG